MAGQSDTEVGSQPVTKFARYFRAYGIGISLLLSALPLATAAWNVIPMFEGAKPLLTAVGSFSSFLLFGIIFAQRHAIARLFFPGLQAGKRRVAHTSELNASKRFSLVPLFLGVVSLLCLSLYFMMVRDAEQHVAYIYAVTLDQKGEEKTVLSICESLMPDQTQLVKASLRGFGDGKEHKLTITCWKSAKSTSCPPGGVCAGYKVQFPDEQTVHGIHQDTPSASVPLRFWMGLFYLGSFMCSVSAFVLTGLKDFLQGELGLSDQELILQRTVASRKERFDVQGAPGVYGIVEYSPAAPELAPVLSGPFCAWHDKEPQPDSIDPSTGKVTKWRHVIMEDGKAKIAPCNLEASFTVGELDRKFRENAENIIKQGFLPVQAAGETLKAQAP